jgi:HSP20 family protein
MAIVKWHGWNPLVPSILDDDNFNPLMNWPDLSSNPSGLDIYETDDAVVVEAQVPGVKEEDVDVTVEGNVLTITAVAKEDEEKKNQKKTVYKSTRQSSFVYSTSLPRMVNSGKAVAEVDNGVVTVTIPKIDEEKPKKVTVTKKK